jgi:hypothetical protein
MSYRVTCISCEYRHDWATLIDAVADGHRHTEGHPLCARPALVTAQVPPREPRERICPRCGSDVVLALGRLFAGGHGVRSGYRCQACGEAFWLPPERHVGPRDRRAS